MNSFRNDLAFLETSRPFSFAGHVIGLPEDLQSLLNSPNNNHNLVKREDHGE
jgi:hypothetical protein